MKQYVIFHDLRNTFSRINLAFILAWYDIKLRYRRTKLGLAWISITVLIESLILSLVFSNLFRESFFDYYPYVFSGRIAWQYISGILSESVNAIPMAKSYILNHNIPPPVLILRICLRNLMIFMHNSIFVLFVCALDYRNLTIFLTIFLLPVVAVMLLFLLFPFALILSILGARYRDIVFLMPYCMKILFYVSPVVWKTKSLTEKFGYYLDFNPFSYMIEMIRDIFLYPTFHLQHFLFLLILGLLAWLMAALFYDVNQKKLCYWML